MTSGPWRIVFLGTPSFAQPSLEALARSGEDVVEVICQPDRPRGRGRKPAAPACKLTACDLDLPVCQPESIKTPEIKERIAAAAPDLLVVVAFGQILDTETLDLPRIGPLNVHPSLLPAYRGPAPINWAVINNDRETGVTTMFLDRGVDSGPTLLSRKTVIGPEETAGELETRLAVLGADLLVETIAGLKAGTLTPTPQPERGVSRAPLLKKSDGIVDWTRPAEDVAALIRGVDPWPGAQTVFRDKNLKLFGARPGSGRGKPGQVLALDADGIHVAAADGSVVVKEFQLAGKKRQPARDFWHGQRLGQNDFLLAGGNPS